MPILSFLPCQGAVITPTTGNRTLLLSSTSTLARETQTQLLDHTYAEHPGVAPLPQCDMGHSFTVMAKYADDITYASTSRGEIDQTKATVPGQLNVYNLNVNGEKTRRIYRPRYQTHQRK